MSKTANGSVRERLIKAGIKELSTNGIENFSVRRVAATCGVSSAAPYKHFENKDIFISYVMEYVQQLWESYIPQVVAKYPGDLRKQLVEIAVRYVHFLVENSQYRSILMRKDQELDQYASLSSTSRTLVEQYCQSVNMTKDVTSFKLYIIRSLIYGAALMFDNGEMEYNERNMGFVRQAINREFDLP